MRPLKKHLRNFPPGAVAKIKPQNTITNRMPNNPCTGHSIALAVSVDHDLSPSTPFRTTAPWVTKAPDELAIKRVQYPRCSLPP